MNKEIHPDDLEIIRNTVKRLQEERDQYFKEKHNLRVENEILRKALLKIRQGEHDPAVEEPDSLEDQWDRYKEWVRRDQDCAIDALNKVKTEDSFCLWTNKEYHLSAACSGLTGWKFLDEHMKFCPFCGKKIEVKK